VSVSFSLASSIAYLTCIFPPSLPPSLLPSLPPSSLGGDDDAADEKDGWFLKARKEGEEGREILLPWSTNQDWRAAVAKGVEWIFGMHGPCDLPPSLPPALPPALLLCSEGAFCLLDVVLLFSPLMCPAATSFYGLSVLLVVDPPSILSFPFPPSLPSPPSC